MSVYHLRQHAIYTTKDSKKTKSLRREERKLLEPSRKNHTQNNFLGFHEVPYFPFSPQKKIEIKDNCYDHH